MLRSGAEGLAVVDFSHITATFYVFFLPSMTHALPTLLQNPAGAVFSNNDNKLAGGKVKRYDTLQSSADNVS